jgi:transposase
MRGPKPEKVVLAVEHVEILQKHLQTGKTERRVADRARILLLSAEGLNPCVVAERTGHDRTTVWRVCQRYRERGLDALQDRPRGGNRTRFSPSASRADRGVGVRFA